MRKRAELETLWGELAISGERSSSLMQFLFQQRQQLIEWRCDRPYWSEIEAYQRKLAQLHTAISAWHKNRAECLTMVERALEK